MPRAKAPRAPRLADHPEPPTSRLLMQWTERATNLERYAPEVARAIRECAEELRSTLKAMANLEVTPTEATQLTGYTTRAIGSMLADGRLENLGNKKRPRVRLADLPIKPGHAIARKRSAREPFDPDVLAFAAHATMGGAAR